jgi:hypothetical protein
MAAVDVAVAAVAAAVAAVAGAVATAAGASLVILGDASDNVGVAVIGAVATAVAMGQLRYCMGASWIANRLQPALFTRPKAIESISALLFKVTIQI